jgi:hypothetical protein
MFWLCRKEVLALFPRIRKLKLPGIESELDQLHVKVVEAAEVSVIAAHSTQPIPEVKRSTVEAANQDVVQAAVEVLESSLKAPGQQTPAELRQALESEVAASRALLEDASRSPKAALMLLSAEIDRELREFMLTTHGQHAPPLPLALRFLPPDIAVAPQLAAAVREFWKVRTRIVHGIEADDDDALRAIDSGLVILKTVKSLPREVNVIYDPGTDVFHQDAGGEYELDKRPDVRTVILETRRPDGTKERRVYPTTRTDYRKGQRVAWEWNPHDTWGESWYLDPDDGEKQYGWASSAEFVGRPIS